MRMKKLLIIASILGASGVILGAFGAHALKEAISVERLQSFEVGVRYQMYHGLALLIIGLNADKIKFSLRAFQICILIGTLLFSLSIYFLAIQELIGLNLKFLGPITPLGGSLMIIGWVIFLLNLFRNKS